MTNKQFSSVVHDNGVAEVVIDRPPVNALNSAGWHGLAAEIEALGRSPEVRVIVIRAEGRGFCAGVDIKELASNDKLIVDVNAGNYATFKAVHLNSVPVIAAVHGFVLGGGIGICGAADIVIAAEDASFGLPEWIVAACGSHAAGAVLVPLNTRMKGAEAADILARSGTKLLFCIGSFLGQYYPALLADQRPASLRSIVVLREGFQPQAHPLDDMTWDDFLARSAMVDVKHVAEREARIRSDSTADLMFTSGTTGRPKGVMAAHGPTIRAFHEWSQVVGLAEGDRYLIVNPFFHTFGYKAGWVAAFISGATVYPEQVFDGDRVLGRIARDRINFLPGPPTLFLTMLAHPRLKDFDISSLHASVTGASSVPPVLIRRMREELGIAKVTTAYGLTECGGCATICHPEDSVETVAGTCGRALPGTELRCVDEQGRTLPPGEPGEVLLRGYHVMQGYFEDPQATAETIDDEGWLHTGDVGVLDERGYLRITDRLKDMFIVGGFNCYPAEIERMLADHPAIAQVAVVGVPDERMGEVGCACVILKPDAHLGEDPLIAWARSRMANYKVPRHVLMFGAFPLNASNKVLKRELAQQVIQRLAIGA